jgi:cyclomaltodextrinase / maltogenic alpha-amylase / neopullulanase
MTPLQKESVAVANGGPGWVTDTVFYQVFPDRFYNGDRSNDPPGVVAWNAKPTYDNFFGGDLAGIAEKLSHLENLGVTGLYMTPIFRAGTNHRYDTHDYLQIDPLFGDAGALRELVEEAHARGIRVLLDGVFNHVGDGFWAFRDVVNQGEASLLKDWFFVHNLPLSQHPPSYQTCGGTDYLPKLNAAHPDVRQHLLSVATHWIEQAGIDGWRLDVPWKVPLDFWRAFRARVKQVRPDAYLVGEAWWSWGEMRSVFDGLMNYRLRARILDFCILDSQDAEDFAIELGLLLEDSDGGELMLNLLGSHDTARIMTLANGDEKRVTLALAALFTLPGTPMIYYGDEVGMEGGDDPDCRRGMLWDETEWNQSLYDLTRTLIRVRREHPALRRGSFEIVLAFNRVLAFRRREGEDEVLVVLNPGAERRDFAIPLPPGVSALSDAVTGTKAVIEEGVLWIPRLRERSGIVFAADDG